MSGDPIRVDYAQKDASAEESQREMLAVGRLASQLQPRFDAEEAREVALRIIQDLMIAPGT